MTELEKSQRVEMEEMLRVMLEFEQKQSRRDVNHIALIAHNLAMLWFVSGDLHKVNHLMELGMTLWQFLRSSQHCLKDWITANWWRCKHKSHTIGSGGVATVWPRIWPADFAYCLT